MHEVEWIIGRNEEAGMKSRGRTPADQGILTARWEMTISDWLKENARTQLRVTHTNV